MAKTSEKDFGLAVMRLLQSRPNHRANVRVIIEKLPDFISLTEEDQIPSATRPHEQMWEQRVRNLKSHDATEGNIIGEGYVARVGRGVYQLTEAGLISLGAGQK